MIEPTPPGSSPELAALAQLPFAEMFEPQHLVQIASCATLEDHTAEALLFTPGQPADSLRMLVSGRVCLTLQVPGRASTQIAALSRGDMFGWEALREGSRRSATARVAKAARCLRWSDDVLRELCELDHELGYRIMTHAFNVVTRALDDCRVQLLDVYGHAG